MSQIVVATSESILEKSLDHTAASAFKLGHRPELDGVRGISILLVLFLHLRFTFLPGGFLGVDIFFVLSGFLITSLLAQEWEQNGSISLKNFYIRRALRLLPALGLLLFASAAYSFIFLSKGEASEVYQGILLTLSYVSNWVFALNPRVRIGQLGITWSLAIEEQFYLIWPLVLWLLLRLKLRRHTVLCLLILAVVAVMIHRRALFQSGAVMGRLYYATDTRADALLVGCLAALLLSWNVIPRSVYLRPVGHAILLVAIALIAYLVITSGMHDPILYLGFFTLVSLAVAVILIALMLWPPPLLVSVLRFPPLRWIGRVSYGLYLWHWPVREFMCPKPEDCSGWRVFACAAVAFSITALSFYCLERPFLRLKEKLAIG